MLSVFEQLLVVNHFVQPPPPNTHTSHASSDWYTVLGLRFLFTFYCYCTTQHDSEEHFFVTSELHRNTISWFGHTTFTQGKDNGFKRNKLAIIFNMSTQSHYECIFNLTEMSGGKWTHKSSCAWQKDGQYIIGITFIFHVDFIFEVITFKHKIFHFMEELDRGIAKVPLLSPKQLLLLVLDAC